MKICPICLQEVDDEATICESCGYSFADMTPEEEAVLKAEAEVRAEVEAALRADAEKVKSVADETEAVAESATTEGNVEEAAPAKPKAKRGRKSTKKATETVVAEKTEEPTPVEAEAPVEAPAESASVEEKIEEAAPAVEAAPVQEQPVIRPLSPFGRGPKVDVKAVELEAEKAAELAAIRAAERAAKREAENISAEIIERNEKKAEEERRAAEEEEEQTSSVAARAFATGAAAGSDSGAHEKLLSSSYQQDPAAYSADAGIAKGVVKPTYVPANEEPEPSPFAPLKPGALDNVTSDKKPGSGPIAESSSKPSSSAGHIQASAKICPNCGTPAFHTETNCKNCGYRYPSAMLGMEKKRKPNILGIFAAIAMGVSVVVDFITYNIDGVQQELALINRMDGYVFLLLAILALVFAIFGRNAGVITAGVLAVLAVIAENWYLIYDLTQVKNGTHLENEIGYYLLIAGAAAILVAGIVGMIKYKKENALV